MTSDDIIYKTKPAAVRAAKTQLRENRRTRVAAWIVKDKVSASPDKIGRVEVSAYNGSGSRTLTMYYKKKP